MPPGEGGRVFGDFAAVKGLMLVWRVPCVSLLKGLCAQGSWCLVPVLCRVLTDNRFAGLDLGPRIAALLLEVLGRVGDEEFLVFAIG